VNVLPKTESVKRIASSLTTLCSGGVTSVQVAFVGETESSNDTFETWVPAMYIALPVFQSVPSDGSPAFWRSKTSVLW
jgi:hypothetical protein